VRPLRLAEVAAPNGLTGRGQILGLADSGLDGGSLSDLHPDLVASGSQKSKVVKLQSLAGRAVPDDPNGHGTHMAGTMAGTGKASQGQFRGLAPEAGLYFQALLNTEGELSPPSDLKELFGPAYQAGVRVHVNGWGGGLNEYREATAQIDAFIRSQPDFLPVFGAGNAGPALGTLTNEANAKNALIVGASANPRPALDPQALDPLRPVSFSSRGPTQDGRLKPDLLAPGQAIVSTRSRLIESNFPANEAYAVMGGTSMAAAVAGASLGLLREYLEEAQGLADPSAALLKALLINGARVTAEGPGREGFGVLDLAGTVLSLKEKTFRFLEEKTGLARGESTTYSYRVQGYGPLKVTLAWTDPPGEPGRVPALVNDLDLVVEAPDGQVYFGNHFLHPGEADRLNNVEQVYLPRPQRGEYRITVRAARLEENAVPGAGEIRQDFALVWGQAPLRNILSSWEAGEMLVLADGEVLPWPRRGVVVKDEQVLPLVAEQLLPGADLYWVGGTVYVFARTWEVGAVQVSAGPGGTVLMEADPRFRDGGYLPHPQATEPPLVNGRPTQDLSELPVGVRVRASLNPSSQRLWQIRISWREEEGYLARVDPEGGKLWLLGREAAYSLPPATPVGFVDRLVDASAGDAPFAVPRAAGREDLTSGQFVRLMLADDGREALYLSVQRDLAVGRLREVQAQTGRIVLESGKTYTYFPGSPVYKDGQEAKLEDLRPGDHVTAVLLPDEGRVISLSACSRVLYGRVLYASVKPPTVYLVDTLNRFRALPLDRAGIFRWGQRVDAAALLPGTWVRLVLSPDTGEVARVDVAETVEERYGYFAGYDSREGLIRLADGSHYRLSPSALVSREGYYLGPEDVVAGQRVKVWVVAAPSPWERVVAGLQVEDGAGSKPFLQVRSTSQEGGFILSGTTTADRLYLYRADGTRQQIPVSAGGYFASFFGLEAPEETVQVVGLDLADGGWGQQKLAVRPGFAGFKDLRGHWAEAEVLALARAGLVGGYPDGTFRPDQSITRTEVAALVARLCHLKVVPGQSPDFRDVPAIPAWARPAVAAARERGLVGGYPDGTFRGGEPVTRAELACLLLRVADREGLSPPAAPVVLADADRVPAWAREAVGRAAAAGLLGGREGGVFAPRAPATRAEVAAALNRCRLVVTAGDPAGVTVRPGT